jgi:hypothetical protein
VPRNQSGARLAYGRSQKRSRLLNSRLHLPYGVEGLPVIQPQTEVKRVYLSDGELLRPELFRTPAQNVSGEYRTIGRESAYCISFANSSDIFPDVDDLRGAA